MLKTYLFFVRFVKKLLLVFCFLCCFSCSKEGAVSIDTKLEQIDTLISTGQVSQALNELNLLAATKMSSRVTIGVAARYAKLGEKQKAKNILQKALSKNKNNLEFNAIYANFLLQEGNTKEAALYTAHLIGTKYSSLCSELALTKADEKLDPFDKDNIAVFLGAYNSEKSDFWLCNAAIIYMLNGQYKDAFELAPQEIYSKKQALFWATVCYDAGQFDFCSSFLDTYKDLVASSPDSNDMNAFALENDILLQSGQQEKADTQRLHLLKTLFENGSRFPPTDKNLPIVLLNSSIYAKNNNLPSQRYHLLTQLINYYPSYLPGIKAYINYAIDSSYWQENDKLTQQLRSSGRATSSMQVFDDIPKIKKDEALLMLDTLTKKSPSSAADIQVLKLYMEDKYFTPPKNDTNEIDKTKNLNIVWDLIEKYVYAKDVFLPNDCLINYAVYTLIKLDKTQDAQALLYDYLTKKYGSLQDFLPEEHPKEFASWELEYICYFYLLQKKIAASKRIYEYLTFERSTAFSPVTSVNLAMIYSSTNQIQKALDLYTKTSGRTFDPLLKSEILYRIALLQVQQKNTQDAIYSLEYALQINMQNIKARALLQKCKTVNLR